MISLSNSLFRIEIATKGAELQSIYSKQHQLEYMWDGDPAYWSKKSPVLFPIVGGLINNTYRYAGEEYKLNRHGFARESTFEVAEQTDLSATFLLSANELTRKVYPFDFNFMVKYTLKDAVLEIAYIVENKDEKDMLFSVGGHPAFKVPLTGDTFYNDYYLLFDIGDENLVRYPLSADGLIETTPSPLLSHSNKLPLTRELFAKDALVLKDITFQTVSLLSNKTPHGLTMHFEGFPYLGIWAAKGANFVCIEPWCGVADATNASGNLEHKEGMEQLQPGEVFTRSFTIEVF